MRVGPASSLCAFRSSGWSLFDVMTFSWGGSKPLLRHLMMAFNQGFSYLDLSSC